MTHSSEEGRARRCGVPGGGRGVGRMWRRRGRQLRDHGGRGARDGQAGGPRRRQGGPGGEVRGVLRREQGLPHRAGPVRRRDHHDRRDRRRRHRRRFGPGRAAGGRRLRCRGGGGGPTGRRRRRAGADRGQSGTGQGEEARLDGHDLGRSLEPGTPGAGGRGQPREEGRERAERRPGGHQRRDPVDPGVATVQRRGRRSGDVVAAVVRRRRLPHRRAASAGRGSGSRLHHHPPDLAARRRLLRGRGRRGLRPGDGGGRRGPPSGTRAAEHRHRRQGDGCQPSRTTSRPRAEPPPNRPWPRPPPCSRRSRSPASGTVPSTASGAPR